jgi:hypothetical protein
MDSVSIHENFNFMKFKLQGSNYSQSLLAQNTFTEALILVISENKHFVNNDGSMSIEDIRIKK